MIWAWLKRRWERQRAEVLGALAERPGLTGAQLMERTGYGSGTVYPILIAAEERGAVTSEWGTAATPGGPRPRHYYLAEGGDDAEMERGSR